MSFSIRPKPTMRVAAMVAPCVTPAARRVLLCAALAVLTATSCSARLQTVTLSIESESGAKIATLDAEVAITDKEQETGYMNRTDIPDGTAMIFAYESDRRMNFWMKNTPHPLSIAFIDSSGVLREIYDMKSFSLETVSSERSLRFALEVPQGWFGRAGVSVGDRLDGASLDSLSALVDRAARAAK